MMRRDIQGLRGLAVLAVVAFHSGLLLPGGYLGVDLFFVISGFVITLSIWNEIQRTGSFHVFGFFSRRILRLAPAAIVVAIATLIGFHLLGPVSLWDEAARAGFAASTLWANAYLYWQGDYFSASVESNPFLHTWSLSVEEQFYLAWPLVVLITVVLHARVGVSIRRTLAAIATLISLVSFALLLFLLLYPTWAPHGITVLEAPERFAFYSPFTRAWQFLMGALALLFTQSTTAASIKRRGALRWVGLAGLAAAFGFAGDANGLSLWGVLAVTTSAVVLLVTGHSNRSERAPVASAADRADAPSHLDGVTERAWLEWVGDRSYSLYLWHWPLIAILLARDVDHLGWIVSAIVASMVLADLTYRFVETPFRAQRSQRAARRAVLVAITYVGSMGLFMEFSGAWGPSLERYALAQRAEVVAYGRTNGCHHSTFVGRIGAGCTLEGPSSETVWLVGDSHADALSDAFVEAQRTLGFDGTIVSFSGCSYTLDEGSQPRNLECTQHNAWLRDQLRRASPDAIVVANRGFSRLDRADIEVALERPPSDVAEGERAKAYVEDLRTALDAVSGPGTSVALVTTVPEFERPPIESVFLFGDFPTVLPSARTDAFRSALLPLEERMVATLPHVELVDFYDAFCRGGRCTVLAGDQPLWRDDDHLSVAGSRHVAPVLQDAIEQLLERSTEATGT